MATEEIKYNDYDGFAWEYARYSETNPFNALYERPAIMSLAGDVRGLRVLDAGCGPGAQAGELIKCGATVTGIDLSGELLGVARQRLGPDISLHQADLAQPLVFGDDEFDLVLSSLVMHYLPEWEPTLREFRRVLVPGGRLVFSTHHPLLDMRISGSDDYFDTYAYTEEWVREGRTMSMRFWHRPLRAMLAAFDASGFTLDTLAEPAPQPEMADESPDDYQYLTRNAQFVILLPHRARPVSSRAFRRGVNIRCHRSVRGWVSQIALTPNTCSIKSGVSTSATAPLVTTRPADITLPRTGSVCRQP